MNAIQNAVQNSDGTYTLAFTAAELRAVYEAIVAGRDKMEANIEEGAYDPADKMGTTYLYAQPEITKETVTHVLRTFTKAYQDAWKAECRDKMPKRHTDAA